MNLRVLYIFTVLKRVIKPKSLMFTVMSNKLHNCGSLRWIAGACTSARAAQGKGVPRTRSRFRVQMRHLSLSRFLCYFTAFFLCTVLLFRWTKTIRINIKSCDLCNFSEMIASISISMQYWSEFSRSYSLRLSSWRENIFTLNSLLTCSLIILVGARLWTNNNIRYLVFSNTVKFG